ncbi:hypothetical protein [Roseateles microcysteis]|uniref:hypothetical protein n=1 Tax=Roseateles microcysteis TaxID=3119057 RepID=UPI002FE540B4
MRLLRCMTLAGALLASLLPVHAQERSWRDPDRIVGRADADASGRWPVALLVLDGERRTLTIRARREQLGTLEGREWRAVDADALMSLERYGAPHLVEQKDFDNCLDELTWRRPLLAPPSDYIRPVRFELAHPDCQGPHCQEAATAWQIELNQSDGPDLPLGRLLPGLGRAQAERLVLYVASRGQGARVERLKELVQPSFRMIHWPAGAATRFPSLHVAMLEHYGEELGFAKLSVVERVEGSGPVGPSLWGRRWGATEGQRQALGLDGPSLRDHRLTRILLRLHPEDVVESLPVRPVTAGGVGSIIRFWALAPATAGVAACESRLQALHCEPACEERLKLLGERRPPYREMWGVPLGDDLASCKASCEAQKLAVPKLAERYYGTEAEARQQRGWQLVEELTGKPAAEWRKSGPSVQH